MYIYKYVYIYNKYQCNSRLNFDICVSNLETFFCK